VAELPPSFLEFLEFIQQLAASRLTLTPFRPSTLRRVAALDVAYTGNKARCGAILYDLEGEGLAECLQLEEDILFPYIPTFLFIREAPLMVKALRGLKTRPELILVDGHGALHPRRAGLATFIGLATDRPTLGVAKRLLVGRLQEDQEQGSLTPVELEGRCWGYRLRAGGRRPLYLSPGNRLRPEDIPSLVQEVGEERLYRLVQLADRVSRSSYPLKKLGCP
jgi:deoxyribonuclease V